MSHPASARPRAVRQRTAQIRRAIGGDLRRLREDAGVRLNALAEAAGISKAHLSGIETGAEGASLEVLVALSHVLGADVSVRLFPETGPRIRDRIQSRMGDGLVRDVHARWSRFLEVPVHRPVHGVIDLVLHAAVEDLLVALELESGIRRLEQQLRWAHQKRDALPSADLWRFLQPPDPAISGALVLPNTRRNQEVASASGALLSTEFPASTSAAVASLEGETSWPGPALLWMETTPARVRLLDRPPRGVLVGR